MRERLRMDEEVMLEAPGANAIALPRTNAVAIALTLLMPSTVSAGFVWLALRPEWNDTGEWALGMLLLVPFEFVRVVVFWILRDAYKDFRTPWQAVRFFLLSLLALAVILLVITSFELGPRATFSALLDPQTWRVVGVPIALIVTDGVIGLLCFRGDPQCEAARLDAQGDDAQDWFSLAMYALPLLVLLPCFVLFVAMEGNTALPPWLPRGGDGARAVCLLYVAAYFAGKGLLLAQVHTTRFMLTGRRVLANGWVQFVLERDAEKRRKNARLETEKAAARRAAFSGSGLAETP